ncbi:MAG TPA: ubiquinol-cytochrome C reductase, partial [Marmoricola sp.]|nr:ubiquinol-cytochrome C reductase [Marmoricola sp.]
MTDQHDSSTDLVPAEPIADPGLEPHHPRPTDIDPSAEKRAERQVATFFVAAMVFAVLFVVAYFSFSIGEDIDTFLGLGASHITLGATLGLALLCIGVGIIQWARKLMADKEIVEYRHAIASSEEDRQETVGVLQQGLEESGLARRPLIRNTMIGAVALLGLPAIVSL